jgi:hypothetical protein
MPVNPRLDLTVVTFRRRRAYPVLGDRIRWPLFFVVLILLGGLGGALTVRAEEPDEALVAVPVIEVPTVEVPRAEPASRGNRPAVLERDEVVGLAAEVFGPDLAGYVARIVHCESTNRPGADTNWPYVGLMQVDPYIHAGRVGEVVGYRVTPAQAAELLRDPRVNLLTAALVRRDQGWGAWPVCRYAR